MQAADILIQQIYNALMAGIALIIAAFAANAAAWLKVASDRRKATLNAQVASQAVRTKAAEDDLEIKREAAHAATLNQARLIDGFLKTVDELSVMNKAQAVDREKIMSMDKKVDEIAHTLKPFEDMARDIQDIKATLANMKSDQTVPQAVIDRFNDLLNRLEKLTEQQILLRRGDSEQVEIVKPNGKTEPQ